MKALIIEDEILVAKDLKKLLADTCPFIEIQDIVKSVEESVTWLKTNPMPDIIFMDIQLNDGTSFDIFKQLAISCPVIFTTAYDEYAIRAFKVNSIGYLLKPIDKKELMAAVEKFRNLKNQEAHINVHELKNILNQINNQNSSLSYKERFLAKLGKMSLIVPQERIVYFQKENLIYLANNEKQQLITDFNTLESLEELLDPKIFFRANRQTLINIKYIDSYRSDSIGKLTVKLKIYENLAIDISRDKALSFKMWLGI